MDLREQCDHLLQISSRGRNPASYAELHEAIHSKWEGVQITAARGLARWADDESIDAIKALLHDFSNKSAHWAAASAVAHVLAPLLHEGDIPWVLDLFFESSNCHNRSSLTELFTNLPPKITLQEIQRLADQRGADARDVRLAKSAIEYASRMSASGR